MSTGAAVVNTGDEAMPSSYPDLDATSPTDSVIAGDFGTLSAAEQVSVLGFRQEFNTLVMIHTILHLYKEINCAIYHIL